MSLVTRCTSCGTMFKVVADQLKISDGWVRCGQCATVFDAQSNLVTEPFAQSSAPIVTPASSASPPATPVVAPPPERISDTPAPAATQAFADETDEALEATPHEAISFDEIADFKRSRSINLPGQEADSLISSDSVSLPAPVDSLVSSNTAADSQLFKAGGMRDLPSRFDDDDRITTNWGASQLPASSLSPADDEALTSTLSSALQAPLVHPPSFVTQAERAARWRSPWVRFGLSIFVLTLLAGLALQIALHEKDRIAAMYPEAEPWLAKACATAGCQVQPLKRIESIAVDASSFNRINKTNAQIEATTQSYKLAVTLKNTGTLPVALPHIELSLQDAQDQPLLRRVLSPADLGSSLQALAPAQDMAGSLTLQVGTAQLAGNRISGYRVLAFYP
jgi:predicted Zn finger-like uncharacterized protein